MQQTSQQLIYHHNKFSMIVLYDSIFTAYITKPAIDLAPVFTFKFISYRFYLVRGLISTITSSNFLCCFSSHMSF